jgi:hypothetical protein
MSSKCLHRNNSVFRTQESELIQAASVANGPLRKNRIALRNNSRLESPLAELLDAYRANSTGLPSLFFAEIGSVIN